MPAPPAPSTLAEQTGYKQTGRLAEVEALCAAWQLSRPAAVRCDRWGISPEGRPLLAIVASTSGALTPDEARERKLPVVVIQGGIHAGEIDGKDAGFAALRDVLDGPVGDAVLARQVLVFVPVFNVDGHERFGAWMRPNQRGPEASGWRTTGQNLNLNRDYVKADAPEMRFMLAMLQRWDPLAVVDLHVTDGAQFEHDIAVIVEPVHSGDEALRAVGRAWRDRAIADLAGQGALPLAFYPSFVVEDDPASGFQDGVASPRFSTGYFPLRNRLAMLVETHSWKDYPTRVQLTRTLIVSVLKQIAENGASWRTVTLAADQRARSLAGQSVALDYAASPRTRTIDFRGYAYTRSLSEISGALMTRYDESRPEIWRVPMRDEVLPATVVRAPAAGYLVPPAHAALVVSWLRRHGIEYLSCASARTQWPVQTFAADTIDFDARSVEGHQRLSVSGIWRDELRDLAAGTLLVPIAQPRARLLMALLEPQAPDSMLAWGLFNNFFEKKETMEPYVAEAVARQQLAADPQLARDFAQRLASNEAFAKDPQARLEFFHRRHPSWDQRYGVYPLWRARTAPPDCAPQGNLRGRPPAAGGGSNAGNNAGNNASDQSGSLTR